MTEKFRLLRQRAYRWLIGSPPELWFHGVMGCDGHTRRQCLKQPVCPDFMAGEMERLKQQGVW